MKSRACLGIDVSKGSLDCCLYDGEDYTHKRFNSNNANTTDKIVQHFNLNQDCLIVMEATGVYHQNAFKAFYEKKLSVVIENPLRIKSFSKMKMRRTKTDKADSRLIANYGYTQSPKVSIPRKVYQEKITSIMSLVDGYKSDLTILANRLEAKKHNSFDVKELIKSLNKQIKSTKEEIKK